MVMVSQTMAVVGQTQKRIQVCDLSSYLRSLMFLMVAVIPGRPVRNCREREGSGVEEIPDALAMILGSSSTLCEAIVDRAVVCVHPSLVPLHRHLQRAK